MASVTPAAVSEAQEPATPTHIEKVARGGFFNLAGSVISAIVTLLFTVAITRGLHQGSAGVFLSLSAMFTLVFSAARLGVPTGVVYFIPRQRALGQVERLRPTIIAAVLPVVVISLVLGVVGVIWAPQLAPVLVHRSDPDTILLFRLLAVFLVAAAVNDVGVGSTRGFGVMRPLVFIDRVGRPTLQLLCIVGVLAVGWRNPTAVGVAWVAPYLPACVLLLLWTRQLTRKTIRRSRQAAPAQRRPARVSWRAEFGPFWRFTLPRTIGSIAQMVLQRADVILIAAMRGPVDAAVYAAATRFLVFGQLGGGAISTTIQPKISGLLAKHDKAGASEVYRIATVWLMLLTWPIYLLFAVFSTDLLRIFGRHYTVGANVIVILSVTMLVATWCGAVDVVLGMAGRSVWTMYNAIAALAADLILNIILIPRIGIVGAAIAWAVAILINNIVPLLQLALWMGLHPFGRATTLAAILPAVCFGALPLIARPLVHHALAAELGVAFIGGLIYLAFLWRLREPLQLNALLSIKRPKRAPAATAS
jgi:O-antigen/teichoic acid export membrane protein